MTTRRLLLSAAWPHPLQPPVAVQRPARRVPRVPLRRGGEELSHGAYPHAPVHLRRPPRVEAALAAVARQVPALDDVTQQLPRMSLESL